MWLVPLSLLIFFELVADIFAKEYSLHGSWLLWSGAILGYVVANAFWLNAIKNGSGLARGATIFSVASAIIAVTLGILFYKESASTLQIAGMILGVIAITLIFWNGG